MERASPSSDQYPSWLDNANCKGSNTEQFFASEEAQARAIEEYCQTCSVVVQCLRFAIQTKSTVGVYGATTEAQRRRITSKKAS